VKNDEVRKLKFENWPLPDEYLMEIGRVAELWAMLESQVNVFIGKLAGFDLFDPKPFILVTHASFPQRLDMLASLCQQLLRDYPTLTEYEKVVGKLRAAQSERNKYMHHGMSLNPETGRVEMAIGSARGSLKVSVEPITIADIRRAAMSIHEAMLALSNLVLGRADAPMWERQ
jgi:hypothetical protein